MAIDQAAMQEGVGVAYHGLASLASSYLNAFLEASLDGLILFDQKLDLVAINTAARR